MHIWALSARRRVGTLGAGERPVAGEHTCSYGKRIGADDATGKRGKRKGSEAREVAGGESFIG